MRTLWGSFRILLQPPIEKCAQPPQRGIIQLAIGNELSEKPFRRPPEELPDHPVYRARACFITFDERGIAMRAPLDFARDVTFLLQYAQQCKDRGIRRSIANCLPHLRDGTRSALPQHGHELDLSWRKPLHVRILLLRV